MAAFSVHKSPNSPFWSVYFRLPDSGTPGGFRQCTRSTKQKTKSEAKKAAVSIVAAAEAEAGAGTQKGREIYALLQEAARKAEAGKLNVAMGRDILARMIAAAGGGEMRSFTVRDWMNQWLAGKGDENAKPGGKGGKAKSYSPATYARYAGNVKTFLASLPGEKADGDLVMLTAEDIRRWRDKLREGGRTAATVNDAVKAIRTALNAARKEGIVIANVAEAVPMLAEADSIRATFSPEDVRRLTDAAEDDWRGVILFAYFAGASLTDITNLRWRQIDLAAGTMSLARRKTSVPVTVPLRSELVAWLTEQPATDDPEDYLFPKLARKKAGGHKGLSALFNGIMEKAGIDGGEAAPEGAAGYTRRALSFHCLRHAFVSALANAGVAMDLRQALAGHSSAAMSEVYTHRDLAPLRAAVNTLPGLPKAEQPKRKNR